MERPVVIEIKNLKINYRNLNHFTIQQIFRNPALRGGNVLRAVRGVDLTVREGEILGIIGENGAGKSTLLKSVAGIFRPDEGTIDTKGRRVSLMSLGVGFRWELSGRENIILAGLLLRYPAAYVREKMEEIIAFSELGEAIDRPMRTYSSGMYSKLSFAISAVLETDIMLIDELLSVGDEHFQRKSYEKIQDLVHRDKMTGIIVSHDMDLIRESCTRVAWMQKGRIMASGNPAGITDMYRRWSAVSGQKDWSCLKRNGADKEGPSFASRDEKTRMYRGVSVDTGFGGLVPLSAGSEEERFATAANWEPLYIPADSKISFPGQDLMYRIFVYRNRIMPEWICTGETQPEGNLASFDSENSDQYWTKEEQRLIPGDSFIRAAVRRKDGEAWPAEFFLEDLIRIEPKEAGRQKKALPESISEEIRRTSEKVLGEAGEGDLVFFLLTDTHAAFGGNWNDTARVIRKLSDILHPEHIVHMGDLTDGLFPEEVTEKVLRNMKEEMEKTGAEVHICIGNHDLAILPGQTEPVDPRVLAERFAGRKEPYGFTDCVKSRVRMIFLSSCGPNGKDLYGFPQQELTWLEQTLAETPKGFRVIVFSHVPPGREKTRWEETIVNSAAAVKLLEDFDRARNGAVLAVFYGHDHRDAVSKDRAFPIVGIGCSKLEDYENRPLHGGKRTRVQGEASQELFDIIIIGKDTNRLKRIRFGSGEDRVSGTCTG